MAFIPQADLIQSGQAKISIDYSFDASAGTIEVCDEDFVRVLLVVNATRSITLFKPSDATRQATLLEGFRSFTLDVDTSSMEDGDELYILYESRPTNNIEQLLNSILIELKITNKILCEVHECDVTQNDVDDTN